MVISAKTVTNSRSQRLETALATTRVATGHIILNCAPTLESLRESQKNDERVVMW